MSLDIFQTSLLAIIQGITEYLPISSSGHLILPRVLLGWEDPGLVFDVAVHVGSLLAVVYYFRARIAGLAVAWGQSLRGRHSAESRLAWLLILATLPAGIAGLLFNNFIEQYARSLLIIAITSIVFGLLLGLADRHGRRQESPKDIADIDWKAALLIGVAQVLALIPGTSRSGITMTAGLFAGLDRRAASEFSFLLAIPIITASGLLAGVDYVQTGAGVSEWTSLLYAILLSAVVSFLCIHFFLKLIQRIGFMPFVVYRMLMGCLLLFLYWRTIQ